MIDAAAESSKIIKNHWGSWNSFKMFQVSSVKGQISMIFPWFWQMIWPTFHDPRFPWLPSGCSRVGLNIPHIIRKQQVQLIRWRPWLCRTWAGGGGGWKNVSCLKLPLWLWRSQIDALFAPKCGHVPEGFVSLLSGHWRQCEFPSVWVPLRMWTLCGFYGFWYVCFIWWLWYWPGLDETCADLRTNR